MGCRTRSICTQMLVFALRQDDAHDASRSLRHPGHRVAGTAVAADLAMLGVRTERGSELWAGLSRAGTRELPACLFLQRRSVQKARRWGVGLHAFSLRLRLNNQPRPFTDRCLCMRSLSAKSTECAWWMISSLPMQDVCIGRCECVSVCAWGSVFTSFSRPLCVDSSVPRAVRARTFRNRDASEWIKTIRALCVPA